MTDNFTLQDLDKEDWNAILEKTSKVFGKTPDLQTMLFLIGHRELGAFRSRFTKEQKLDLIHVATCTLLTQAGYFEFIERDADGWPHFQPISGLPPLHPEQQEIMLKKEIINYFKIHNI
jgi:hypothetical protein